MKPFLRWIGSIAASSAIMGAIIPQADAYGDVILEGPFHVSPYSPHNDGYKFRIGGYEQAAPGVATSMEVYYDSHPADTAREYSLRYIGRTQIASQIIYVDRDVLWGGNLQNILKLDHLIADREAGEAFFRDITRPTFEKSTQEQAARQAKKHGLNIASFGRIGAIKIPLSPTSSAYATSLTAETHKKLDSKSQDSQQIVLQQDREFRMVMSFSSFTTGDFVENVLLQGFQRKFSLVPPYPSWHYNHYVDLHEIGHVMGDTFIHDLPEYETAYSIYINESMADAHAAIAWIQTMAPEMGLKNARELPERFNAIRACGFFDSVSKGYIHSAQSYCTFLATRAAIETTTALYETGELINMSPEEIVQLAYNCTLQECMTFEELNYVTDECSTIARRIGDIPFSQKPAAMVKILFDGSLCNPAKPKQADKTIEIVSAIVGAHQILLDEDYRHFEGTTKAERMAKAFEAQIVGAIAESPMPSLTTDYVRQQIEMLRGKVTQEILIASWESLTHPLNLAGHKKLLGELMDGHQALYGPTENPLQIPLDDAIKIIERVEENHLQSDDYPVFIVQASSPDDKNPDLGIFTLARRSHSR